VVPCTVRQIPAWSVSPVSPPEPSRRALLGLPHHTHHPHSCTASVPPCSQTQLWFLYQEIRLSSYRCSESGRADLLPCPCQAHGRGLFWLVVLFYTSRVLHRPSFWLSFAPLPPVVPLNSPLPILPLLVAPFPA